MVKTKFPISILRKYIHVIVGTILLGGMIIIHRTFGQFVLIIILLGLTGIYGLFDLGRMRDWWRSFKEEKKIEKVYTRYESHRFSGAFFSLCAALVTMLVFPFEIAIASMAINIYSDPISFYVKQILNLQKRSLVGSLPYIWVGIFAAWMLTRNLPLSITMSLAATIADRYSTKIDDNCTTPIAAAIAGIVFMTLIKGV